MKSTTLLVALLVIAVCVILVPTVFASDFCKVNCPRGRCKISCELVASCCCLHRGRPSCNCI